MQPKLAGVVAGLVVASLLAASAAGAAAFASPTHQHSAVSDRVDPAKQQVFRNAMGKLWEDHITWTRLFVVSALANLPDTRATAERLLQNQVDIGNAIKPYYGDAAGDRLTALLKDHILIAADLVAAAKAGDSAALTAGQARWETNADDIGALLSGANPDHWTAEHIAAMMREHLALTTSEVVARLNQDWATDIAAYEQIHLHILELADMLSEGIVSQFPERFA
jgi:hypothetical protein